MRGVEDFVAGYLVDGLGMECACPRVSWGRGGCGVDW